jgi:hypothetical protein
MTSSTISRPHVVALLNEALSSEYNSFIGHALASNPYVASEWEGDLELLEKLRDEENDLSRAILVQFGRYRAGPTLAAFALWKEDLNFLALDWLVIRAADEAQKDLAAAESRLARSPTDDMEFVATFEAIVNTKRRHAEQLAELAATRKTERDARRATHRAVTAIKVPGLAAPAAAKPAAAVAAPARPSGGPAPKLPSGFKAPTSAPKAPSPPLPPGAKAPAAPTPASAPAAPAAPAAPKKSTGHPPLPPGFKHPNA